MKQLQIMITENKFTEIFCIADDFSKEFDAEITVLSFKISLLTYKNVVIL